MADINEGPKNKRLWQQPNRHVILNQSLKAKKLRAAAGWGRQKQTSTGDKSSVALEISILNKLWTSGRLQKRTLQSDPEKQNILIKGGALGRWLTTVSTEPDG